MRSNFIFYSQYSIHFLPYYQYGILFVLHYEYDQKYEIYEIYIGLHLENYVILILKIL